MTFELELLEGDLGLISGYIDVLEKQIKEFRNTIKWMNKVLSKISKSVSKNILLDFELSELCKKLYIKEIE